MPYTINISIIHTITQYLFVLNKFYVINLLQKNDGGPQTSKKMYVALGKKRVPIPVIDGLNQRPSSIDPVS